MTGDNGVPGSLYETIYAKGQREALEAVRRAIDDVEIVKGQHVPRALKDIVRVQLEGLPATYAEADAAGQGSDLWPEREPAR